MKQITIQYSLIGDCYEVVRWTEVGFKQTTIEVLAKFASEQSAKSFLLAT